MANQAEARNVWSFGLQAGASGSILGATGAGVRYFVNGLAREHSVYVETDGGATCSYQVLTARTLTGASVVLSSGTLSTGAVDIVQITGPLAYIFPRIKTLTSTSVVVTVELLGN